MAVQAAFDELNEPENIWEVINLTIDLLFILDVAKVTRASRPTPPDPTPNPYWDPHRTLHRT